MNTKLNYWLLLAAVVLSSLARLLQHPALAPYAAAVSTPLNIAGSAAFVLAAWVALSLWRVSPQQRRAFACEQAHHYSQQLRCIALCLLSGALSTGGWFLLFRWNGAQWQRIHVLATNVVLLGIFLVVLALLVRGLRRVYSPRATS